MGILKRPESKVVIKSAGGTYLDVRIVHTHEGYGRQRKVKSSEYAVFHAKNRVSKEKFNKPELAVNFITENFSKYDKKNKKFK